MTAAASQLDLFAPRWLAPASQRCGRCAGSGHVVVPGRFADIRQECRACAGSGRLSIEARYDFR